MTHTVKQSELDGKYTTDLVVSTKEHKQLRGTLWLGPDGGWGYTFSVLHKGNVVLSNAGLAAAIRAYNAITEVA